MATILLTGASGFVGSHLLPHLLDNGHQVRALVRNDSARDRILRRLDPLRARAVTFAMGDITRVDSVAAAVRGVDAVVHLVGIARDGSGGRDLDRVNRGGTRNLIKVMQAAGVRRLVHQGALGVVEQPSLHYATSKARAERDVAGSDLDWTILKPSLMWGDRDGFFNLIALLVRISPGVVPYPARQDSRFQPLWVEDLARIVVDVLARPETVGRTYELGGPDHWTYREMTAEVLRGMHRRRFLLPMPLPLIKLVARSSEVVHLPFPVASDQLRQLAFDNITRLDGVSREFRFAPASMKGRLTYLRRRVGDQEPGRAAA